MKYIRRICAIVIGITFLLSGLLKILDPVGTGLIVTEYAKFLGLGFLIPGARVHGVILSIIEALTGLALITGVLRKVSAWITLVLVGGFTLITLVLLVKNPSMDCGCFGEAVHLDHLQSFVKNLALLALALIAFIPLGSLGRARAHSWVSFGITALAVIFAVIYSNTHIPVLDFTEYAPGARLMAAFDEEDEWDTSSPILSFRDALGEYQDSLAADGPVVVFSVYEPSDAPWERIHNQYQAVLETGAMPLLLVASYPLEIDSFGIPVDMTVHYADYKTLITLNRSNGGATYLYDGEIEAKWHSRDFPAHIDGVLNADPIEVSSRFILSRRIRAGAFALSLLAVLVLV